MRLVWPVLSTPLPLAQQGTGGIVPYLAWVGAFIVVVVLAGVALLAYRRRMLSDEHEADRARGLLDGLRLMRDRGDLSQEEYDTARRTITARLAGRSPGESMTSPRTSTPGARVAPPGVDLTGEPLPRPGSEPPDQGSGG